MIDIIKFVYGIFPVFITYTDDGIKEGAGAFCKNYGWYVFIKIRPKYISDPGILKHELEHAKQTWRWFFLFNLVHPILYRFSDTYRLKCEIKAYKKQLWNEPAIYHMESFIDKYSGYICDRYNINGITKEEVAKVLVKEE